MNKWLNAARPRTLVLSLSGIILGSFLAHSHNQFSWTIAILAGITAVLLQTLSNFANDYGDFKHGADSKERIGPKRAVQSGKITPQQMKKAMIKVSFLAGFTGALLVVLATPGLYAFLIFGVLGLSAIIAAITYTSGKLPYGYHGFGDVFVFIFFGLVSVLGTYYLHTNTFTNTLLLPAAALGCLIVGVLNINNMRDYKNDKKAGKTTQVVRMGYANAKIYHSLLIFIPFILTSSFILSLEYTLHHWLFLLIIPFLAVHLHNVLTKKPEKLDKELGRLALITLSYSLLISIGLIL